MFFRPIISQHDEGKPLSADIAKLASDLGIPTKNVRQWWYNDSIPGIWYERVAATGVATLAEIAAAGTAQGIAAGAAGAPSSTPQGAAA